MNPKVYREASETVEKINTSACDAISRACNYNADFSMRYKRYLYEMFQPKHKFKWELWWGQCTPENQLTRAIALDLMAEIVEDENEKRN